MCQIKAHERNGKQQWKRHLEIVFLPEGYLLKALWRKYFNVNVLKTSEK
jgi:hypothetical protein